MSEDLQSRVNELEDRVNELEDALEEVMGIWESHLDVGDSKSAGAEMVRVVRLASLGQLEDGTTLEEVRNNSIRELRHKVLKLESEKETALAMLRDWNPTPMADTLRVVLDSQLEGSLSEEEQAELDAARERVDATPTLEIPEDADEVTKLRYIVGLQGLLISASESKAVTEFMEKQRFRMGSTGGKCPECGYDLINK